MKIKLWLMNHGHFAYQGFEFSSLDAAKMAAKKIGYETSFMQNDQVIGSWSPLTGYSNG